VSGTGPSPTINYVPTADFNGGDSFDVTVSDGSGGSDTITVNVTVNPQNDAPVIDQTGPLVVSMDEDGSPTAFIAPTITATDGDGDALTWSGTAASNGTATVSGTGPSPIINYVPTADFNGGDSFDVTVSDGSGGSDTITVNVTVNPHTATDGDGDTLTWSGTTAASGTATVSGTGPSPNISYVPTANFNGGDSFDVTVNDGSGSSDTITVNVTVSPQNDAPTADAGTAQTVTDTDANGSEDITLDGTGSGDSDGALVSYAWEENSVQIATGVNPVVSLSVGTHTIDLTVMDDAGAMAVDTVVITVLASNVPPTADAGTAQTVTDTDANGSEDVTLDGTGSGDSDGALVSYVWEENSEQIATGANPIVSLAVGTHTIDLTVTDDQGATATDTVVITVLTGIPTPVDVRIAQSSDDVEERPSGAMSFSSSDLELVRDRTQDQTVGLRFQNVNIPQGATITAAYLEFEADEVDSSTTSINIAAEATDNATAFTNVNYNLTGRFPTIASVTWDIPAWNTINQKHQSPDLSTVVQEVVGRTGWNANNSMVFIITGSGERTAESYNGEPAAAPLLHIEYLDGSGTPDTDPPTIPDNVSATAVSSTQVDVSWTGSTDLGGGVVSGYKIFRSDIGLVGTVTGLSFSDTTVVASTSYDYTVSAFDNATPIANESSQSAPPANAITPPTGDASVDVRIAQSSDDVEERSSGAMNFSSSDLELVRDGTQDQTVGLRFQNVNIPQGATITAAYLEFEADETDSSPTSISIAAEAVDNATAFTKVNFNLTGRLPTIASVTWDIPAWTTVNQKHQSPDLSTVVQEVVGRTGWNANNSLVIIITGSGERTAESYNGEPAAAPLLHVEYSSGN
jgi:hypothetical protein